MVAPAVPEYVAPETKPPGLRVPPPEMHVLSHCSLYVRFEGCALVGACN